MGGRGSGSGMSGGGTGMDVTSNGKTTRYYFTSKKGQNYYQRGIGGKLQPTPLNMSAKEFKARAISNGATVKNITSSERNADIKKYKTDRAVTNKILNQSYVSDKEFVKGSRAIRKGSRGTKRR